MPSVSSGIRCFLTAGVAAVVLAAPSVAEARRVAVIIGVGSYAKLDPSLTVPDATSTAAQLALALDQHAGYDQVLPLIDAVATRAGIEELLLETLPSQLSADDSLLLYFVGHGIGGDFGEPYLLPYDVDPGDVQSSALSVESLSSRLRNALPVSSMVVITDAVHDMRLDDLVLMGPNAKSWSDITDEFFSLSASSPREIPGTTNFGQLVTDGLSGAADSSADGLVSANELHRFVLDHLVGSKAHPAESGNYNPELSVAEVARGPQDFAAYGDSSRSARPRRITGAVLGAVGIGLAGGGLGLYLDGLQVYPYVGQNERPLPEGMTIEQLTDRYDRDRLWSPILFAASAATLVTGGTLLVWPSPSGAMVGWSTQF